ncbi:MAG: hypothetical protein J7L51_04180 [Desulfurococcales archaeon]|nr:hypothetical protein [Desulfurococcales archaeon]
MSELFEAATGISMNAEELMKAGERIITLERMIQVREGRTRKDDNLPRRITHEKVRTRDGKEYVITEEELNEMLDKYFELRGWDKKTGVPLPNKLKELNLEFTILIAQKVLGT